jgi:hypothetical protein
MTMETDEFGTKIWYNAKRKLHRDNDLPAVECADRSKHWSVNRKQHRDNDLPAVELANGNKLWYVNNMRHRLDGLLTIENVNGYKSWYIYSKKFTYKKVCNYYKILKNFGRYCLKKIRMRQLRRVRYIHGELLCMPPKR